MSLKNIIYNKLAGRKINSSRKLIYYINFNFQYLNLLSRLLLIIIGIHFSFHLNFFTCVCVCVCVCVCLCLDFHRIFCHLQKKGLVVCL